MPRQVIPPGWAAAGQAVASTLQLGTGDKCQFFSVGTCHFLAILVHDIMGSPHLDPESFKDLGVLRAFESRRTQPHTCPLACKFLQQLVNVLIQTAVAKGVALSDVFHAPVNFTKDYGRGLQREEPRLMPIHVSNAGLFDFSAMLAEDSEPFQAAWQDLAANALPANFTALQLTSGSILHAQLGDFLAFALLHLQMWPRKKSHWTGLAFFMIRQFGLWLDKHISEICSFRPLKAIPEIRHMSRAGRVDCRGAVQVIDEENGQALQAMKFHHIVAKQQALCWHYCHQVAFELQKAQFKSLTISSDGWRGKGEAMELYFAFSPELNIGGYLPFQVPHSTQTHTHTYMADMHSALAT